MLISICICTYNRPNLLDDCLASIYNQNTDVDFEVIIIDNDYKHSAEQTAIKFKKLFNKINIPLSYYVEPSQGISNARNLAVSKVSGEYIAFIDDDETANEFWLQHLYTTIIDYQADAVWGPVQPVFAEGFPEWQKIFFYRDRLKTGQCMKNSTKATNNVLIRKQLLDFRPGPFDIVLNHTGGEDTALFRWLENKQVKFIWCNEALVYEFQPIQRASIAWRLKRAYRGGWGFSYQEHNKNGYYRALLKSLLWVIPAWSKNSLLAFKYKDPRTISLMLLRNSSRQAGKLGYFLNFKLKVYKKSNLLNV